MKTFHYHDNKIPPPRTTIEGDYSSKFKVHDTAPNRDVYTVVHRFKVQYIKIHYIYAHGVITGDIT